MAHYYGISPLEVKEWKGRDVALWYEEGFKLWEKLSKVSGCAWRS